MRTYVMSQFSKLPLRQIAVYPFVGGFTTGLDLLLYWLLVDVFGVWYLLSAALISPLTLSLNYTLHRTLTFQSSGKKKHELTKYIGLVITNYMVGLFLLYVIVDMFTVHYFIGRLIVFAIIMMWNFLALKYIIFTDSK